MRFPWQKRIPVRNAVQAEPSVERITFNVFSFSETGPTRTSNEDNIIYFSPDPDREIFFAMVADGMGGHNAGEIASFCSTTYEVSFPIFAKVDVNGDHADPIYEFLKSSAPGIFGSEAVKWNFTKFLVDRSGKVVKRYGSVDKPEAIEKDIEKLL